ATIFVVALLLRGACLLYYGPTLTNDSYHYLTVAQSVLDGRGFGLPYRSTPGYALFLAGVLWVAPSHWAIVWAQAVLGALTCVVLATACERLFQPRVALCLGLGVASYIPLAAFCAMVLRETLIAFAVSVTTYCLVRSIREKRQGWHWATGAACGA